LLGHVVQDLFLQLVSQCTLLHVLHQFIQVVGVVSRNIMANYVRVSAKLVNFVLIDQTVELVFGQFIDIDFLEAIQ
jgi:hypothetical protein